MTTPKPPTPPTPPPPPVPHGPAPGATVTEPPAPGPATPTPPSSTTSSSSAAPIPTPIQEPTPDPDRPKDGGPAALFDAVAAEHAAIYGYGLVSAHVMPDENDLVSEALAQHRERREAAVVLMNDQSVKAPLPAPGYQLPVVVNNSTNAAKLAVRMESDCAVAWRAVLEQTDAEKEREFAVRALTQCAVLAARWRKVLGAWPVTEAFPGGSE